MDTAGGYAAAMRRAIALAERGPLRNRNPRVGCVILDASGDVIAEGWHRGAGTVHAEVDALNPLTPEQTVGATAVVTLEPCSHTGTTGPCAVALRDAGVARVVYGAEDPGVRSSGGARILAAAGVEVIGGLLLDETAALIEEWLLGRNPRPAPADRCFVTVKWASSLDGRAAANDGTSQWITGAAARQHVHEQRARADAILVGTGTVLADDPSLTARSSSGDLLPHQPVPVVIGTRPIPSKAAVFRHPHEPIIESSRDLRAILSRLLNRGLGRVFVEGGPTVVSAFVAEGLADEYLIYLAPTLIGGSGLALGDIGVTTLADRHRLRISMIERLGDDVLVVAHKADGTATEATTTGGEARTAKRSATQELSTKGN